MTVDPTISAERPLAVAPGVEFERMPRCRVSPRHYRRATATFAPSPAAVAGALEIYLEGRGRDDVPRMLFGLSVLRSATAEQVEAALAAGNVAAGSLVTPAMFLP